MNPSSCVEFIHITLLNFKLMKIVCNLVKSERCRPGSRDLIKFIEALDFIRIKTSH